ncbi:uncharacterized protein LOC108104602 [Drosophila eugracilis]|uniref:uncharacterized protein LOC108104602 n=1 Tax=Drosophila eugracilis TaxID=29029 RepID=UPI0007E5FA70|nr:uncharacterized protein LOC108104602 [Drosophila eugracilis]
MSKESGDLGISVSYSELEAIDQDDIILLIDVDSAINISKECVTDKSANPVDVLSLWFSKLLRAYINKSVCCVRAAKEMCKWFKIEMDSGVEIHKAHIKLLKDALAFITISRSHLLTAGERLIHILAYLLFSLIEFFLGGSDSSEHHLVVDLQIAVLSLVKEITTGSEKVHPLLTPLMQKIMYVGDIERKNIKDVMILVKTSETLTYISLHYMSYVNFKDEQIPEWLKETISYLCEMIHGYLEDLFNKGKLTVTMDSLEDYLKIVQSYYLMLLQIFNNNMTQINDDVATCIMDLIMCEETKLSNYSDNHVHQLISTYVSPYEMDLFKLVYSFDECQKYLTISMQYTPEFDYFDVCIDFITAVSADNSAFLPNTCQTMQKIFEYLFKDATNFIHAERYERVLNAYACFLYLVPDKDIHRYFCAGLFLKDIISSQVCADILMLCFHLKEVNKCWTDKAIQQAAVFWNKCNNSYAMFSTNISQLHVQRFLKYFHRLGKQGLPAMSTQNFRHLSAVAKANAQLGSKLLERLDHISVAVPTKVEIYYEMAALLELLVQQNQTDCSQWFQRTSDMVKKLLSIGKSSIFTSAYFKLLAFGNKSTQLLILRGLDPTTDCTNWHRQKFVAACKFSDDGQLKAFSARHVIGCDELLYKALQQKLGTLDKASIEGLVNVAKSSYTRQSEHNCRGSGLKRKRSIMRPKEILREIYEGTLQLGQCSEDFDASDWDLHKKVMSNLSKIVPGSNFV